MMMRKKRLMTLILFSLFLVFPLALLTVTQAYSQEVSRFRPGFHLKLTGGFTQSTIGDMNDHLNSMNNYFMDYYGNLASGQIRSLTSEKSDFQLELMWDFSRKLSVGIATSLPVKYRKESALRSPDPQDQQIEFEVTVKPEIEVWMPVKASLYYSIYSNASINLRAYTGVSIFSTKMNEQQGFDRYYPDESVLFNMKNWVSDRSTAAGWHGGLSFEYGVAKNLSILADFEGRLMRNSSMKGRMVYTSATSPGFITDVTAIYASGDLIYINSADGYYDLAVDTPILFDATGLPLSGQTERKARLDLSGFSFQIGFKLRLF